MKKAIKIVVAVFISLNSLAQDTTWFRDSGLPQEKVGGTAFMGANNNIFGYFYAQAWGGLPSQRLVEYDRAGNLLNFGSMPVGYWDFSTYDWLYLGDGSFLASGDGTSPRSQNAKWGRFIVLHDSAGNLIMERTLAQAIISSFFKASDTSFFAIENANTTYLTHFNTKGDTLWQMPFAQLLGISILDSSYQYKLQRFECHERECLAWLTHKTLNEQVIIHFDAQNGQVQKTDTLHISGFVKGNRVKNKSWNGYVMVAKPSLDSSFLYYMDSQFILIWSKQQTAGVGADIEYNFINRDSNIVYTFKATEKTTSDKHTYRK
jgi:hypothetical protein